MTIEQEPKPTEDGKPPAYWPASGDLRVENLSAKYSPVCLPSQSHCSLSNMYFQDGPEVLHDISFNIRSGERIGVGEYRRYIKQNLRLIQYLSSWKNWKRQGNYLVQIQILPSNHFLAELAYPLATPLHLFKWHCVLRLYPNK